MLNGCLLSGARTLSHSIVIILKNEKSKISNIIFRRRRTRMIQISLEAEPQPEEDARDDSANLEIDRDSMKVEWE